MLAFLFSRTGAIVTGVVVAAGVLTYSHAKAYQAGRTAERTATLSRSVEALRERTQVDDQIRTMDDRSLCGALGGLPDECSSLDL